LQTVEVRHPQVHEDDVRFDGGRNLHGLEPICGFPTNLESPTLEQPAKNLSKGRLVVDDHHPWG
jgi:hypothetical protein